MFLPDPARSDAMLHGGRAGRAIASKIGCVGEIIRGMGVGEPLPGVGGEQIWVAIDRGTPGYAGKQLVSG